MSAFEFFFSFYGLLLGFSVAVVATGLVLAVQHRKTVRIGWLTPLLAVFVALDIASFWDQAWTNFRHLPFSYGLLVAGLVIAVTYFVAASMVFPLKLEDTKSLDEHFWANKKIVLLLLVVANLLGVAASVAANIGRDGGMALLMSYGVTLALYMALTLPAAFARKSPLVVTMLGLQIAMYLVIAVFTALNPHSILDEEGNVKVRAAPAAASQ
jgi:hypothetical protein